MSFVSCGAAAAIRMKHSQTLAIVMSNEVLPLLFSAV